MEVSSSEAFGVEKVAAVVDSKEMTSKEDDSLNEAEIIDNDGSIVSSSEITEPSTPLSTESGRNLSKLFCDKKILVTFLPSSFDENMLLEEFRKFGRVVSHTIARDKITNTSRGFGFVVYKSAESAKLAIENLDGKSYLEKQIKVSYARPSSRDILNSKLQVLNIPIEMTSADLENLFSEYGLIIDCKIIKPKPNESSGRKQRKQKKTFGFIIFDRHDQAERALELDGYQVRATGLCLKVKFCERKQNNTEKSNEEMDQDCGSDENDYSPASFPEEIPIPTETIDPRYFPNQYDNSGVYQVMPTLVSVDYAYVPVVVRFPVLAPCLFPTAPTFVTTSSSSFISNCVPIPNMPLHEYACDGSYPYDLSSYHSPKTIASNGQTQQFRKFPAKHRY